jgi:gluconolactonase
MKRPLVALLALVVCAASASAHRGAALPPPTELITPAIPGVVAAGTKIELVKGGFARTEGPVGMPDGSILFTNTDSITRIDLQGNVSTFVPKSNGSNGLGFDAKGRLISVQRAAGNEKVGVLYPLGSETSLADNFDGTPFSRLNDLVVSMRGPIYFTDAAGVYLLPTGGGKVRKVIEGIANPNGVQLSPDEKVLYANDKDGEYLLAFDVKWDGTLANRRNFAKYRSVKQPGSTDPLLAEDNGADGIAVDYYGRVYVATNVGVEVFTPLGQYLGAIPAIWGAEAEALKKPQNLAFSGPDKTTLYMVGAGAVFKVQTLVPGVKNRAK